jgi:hypothetical protein
VKVMDSMMEKMVPLVRNCMRCVEIYTMMPSSRDVLMLETQEMSVNKQQMLVSMKQKHSLWSGLVWHREKRKD